MCDDCKWIYWTYIPAAGGETASQERRIWDQELRPAQTAPPAQFTHACEEMQVEGRQCADWLGKKLDGVLAEPAVGARQATQVEVQRQ